MRALVWGLILLTAATAHADRLRVALMTSGSEQRAALAVALAGRADVATMAPPAGALRLDRAAIAQRAVLDAGADVGVWIESERAAAEVCVVSADGTYFRHSTLPAGESPRVFAAVAASLLDELLAPPEAGLPPVAVDVHVAVDGGSAQAILPPPPPTSLPPSIVASAPRRAESPPPYLELGALAYSGQDGEVGGPGIELELTFAVSEHTRLGALALALGGDYTTFGGGLELRRQLGRPFFVGIESAVVCCTPNFNQTDSSGIPRNDPSVLVAVPLSVRWAIGTHGIAWSIAPALEWFPKGPPGGALDVLSAWIITSLRWEIPT